MGAVILDGAEIGEQSLIGAKTLVTQGMKIPPGSLVFGSPGKVVRQLNVEERSSLKRWAEKYVENARFYREHGVGTEDSAPVRREAPAVPENAQ
jgi:gamma-carbonic anhydrase